MPLSYQGWNDAIAAHFFRPEMAGHTVYLYVTEDVLDELGRPHGATARDFIAAVKRGPRAVWQAGGLCRKALRCKSLWDKGLWSPRTQYPPYIAYLALFALASGIEGDFAPHAYYPRLRSLLGEDVVAGMYPHFNEMWELWDGLEEWAAVDRAGELGIFTVSIAGSWVHVGIPVAQMLLNEHERRALPPVFAQAGLDPKAPAPDPALAAVLLRYGSDELRRRTREMLDNIAARRAGAGGDKAQ